MATYTLYADNAAGNHSGWMWPAPSCRALWITARMCATGSNYEGTAHFYTNTWLSGNEYRIGRLKLMFDISGVTGTVTAATLSLYCETIQFETGGAGGIYIVSGVDFDPNDLVVTDYYQLLDKDISYGRVASAAFVEDTYTDVTINADGLTEINNYIGGGGGWVMLGVRPFGDFNNVEARDDREHSIEWDGDTGDYLPKLVLVTTSTYPTEGTTRVTGIIHRYSPGNYTMEVALGGVTTDFGVPPISKEPQPAIPTEAQFVCTICGAAFPTLAHLVMHSLYEHTDIPPPGPLG